MAAQTLKSVDTASWRTDAPCKNTHGAWYIPVKPRPLIQLSSDYLRTPFGLNCWGEPTQRMNLDVVANDALRTFCENLDSWAIRTVWENRELILPAGVSEGACHAMLKPSLTIKAGYEALMRTKANADTLQVWKKGAEETLDCCEHCSADLIGRNASVIPCVQVAKIWISGKQFGVTLETVACLVRDEPAPKMPFVLDVTF